ncbi:MAG: hypothetical protein JWM05_1425 [Acidimicrobiales bacterium]|nr:hypothetical protein [Acidimicrobiales bacterium]
MTCACSDHHEPSEGSRSIGRRAILGGGLALSVTPFLARFGGVAWAVDERDYGFKPPQPKDKVFIRPIVFPVIGTVSWTDTYLAPRSGGRLHEGQDLMGAKMLKLVAAVSGTVVELKWGSGGNSLYLKGDDGWYYNYLHINNDTPGTDDGKNDFKYAFAPGMAIGSRVTQGQHIAYLGDSGNAETTGSHLHFEIRMPDAHWYNASAVNAKYSLDNAGKVSPPNTFTPMATAEAFVQQQSRDILGRAPSNDEAATWTGRLNRSEISPDGFIDELLGQPGSEDIAAPVVRLYLASFPRVPDDGVRYWIDQVRAGMSVTRVADSFSNTSEFKGRYGSLSNRAFVAKIFEDMFKRAADDGGLTFWTGQLDGGETRGNVVHRLAESAEYRFKIYGPVRVVMIYQALLRRSPDASGWMYWIDQSNRTSDGMLRCIKSARLSNEYARRVGVRAPASRTTSVTSATQPTAAPLPATAEASD